MDAQEPVLNIHSGYKDFNDAHKSKPNRNQRIHTATKTESKPLTPTIAKDNRDTKVTKDRKDKKDNKYVNKNAKKEPVTHLPNFSSLFTSNPSIPNVESTNIQSVKESVFSGTNFSDLPIHKYIVSNLKQKLSISEMTAVQRKGIPHLLKGKDVMLKSQTGSGKTLAYAVPLIHHLQTIEPRIKRLDGPYAIIVVPTRELALQSFETLMNLVGAFNHIVPGCIMGGESRKSEKARLRKGINILVCTPGRLLDHLQNTQSLMMNNVKWLIIDEADRLLELGFEKSVGKIVESLSDTQRQTVLLSATLTKGVENLAGITLKDYVTIDITKDALPKPIKPTSATVDSDAEESDSNSDITDAVALPLSLTHKFIIVPHKLRLVTLGAFLISKTSQKHCLSKILVFLSTKQSVEFHYSLMQNVLYSMDTNDLVKDTDEDIDINDLNLLRTANSPLFKLHGAMPQKERTKVFLEFSAIQSGILLCTDVAARGLDIPKVDWIIQYNTPGSATDYIHRVGRTARIGCKGNALLFLAPSETQYVEVLEKENIKMTELPMNEILKTLIYYEAIKVKYGRQVRSIEEASTFLQKEFELGVHNVKELRSQARNAFQSFVRAYASYPTSLKTIFHIKNLHLGHVAKSFGLSDAPHQIGEIVGKFAKMDSKSKFKKLNKKLELKFGDEEVKEVKKMTKKRLNNMSEFSSGYGDNVIKKKKRKIVK